MTNKKVFYKDCHQLLSLIIKEQIKEIDEEFCKRVSVENANAIYLEMERSRVGTDYANYDVLDVDFEKAKELLETEHYLQLSKHEEENERGIELKERESLINQINAETYQRQAKAAEKANFLSKISIIISLVALGLSILSIIGK